MHGAPSGVDDEAHRPMGVRRHNRTCSGTGPPDDDGQTQGLIESVDTVAGVVDTVVAEAEEIMARRLPSLVVG
ncbi:hypothetical protein [Tsukamurella sp. NPDC003166]|uniref:hypothetical protein n=1 Tax=Tsukamurella sp. NPDC003166 TaxID=3154444 RepID=UPI00339E7737